MMFLDQQAEYLALTWNARKLQAALDALLDERTTQAAGATEADTEKILRLALRLRRAQEKVDTLFMPLDRDPTDLVQPRG